VGVSAVDAGPTDFDALRPVLATAFGAATVELVGVRPLSAGASRLTWTLDALVDARPCRLVLQRERVAGRGNNDMATEAQLLRAAGTAGVPVPAVVAYDASGAVLGGGYLITSYVDGETIPRRILRDPALADARDRFAGQCGRILAAIHTITVAGLPRLAEPDPLDAVQHVLDGVGRRRPAFELALVWLRGNRPPGGRRTLVHGDFRTGNLIMAPDGIRAVLDWELAHIGDPREDLGWLCARAWRWGSPRPVGGMGALPELLESYAGHGGDRMSEADLFWWQVLATLRWGVICLEQARVHLSGEYRSVELAVLGRRAAEMEYELMRMLP
jgi:aminoglycoside phosphotransferase (APT) family kinase protein